MPASPAGGYIALQKILLIREGPGIISGAMLHCSIAPVLALLMAPLALAGGNRTR